MQGVAIFEVSGDLHVILFDLEVSGLRRVNLDRGQFTALNEVEYELRGIIGSDYTEAVDVGLEYNDWPGSRGMVLARIYVKDGKPYRVLLASYDRGLVTKLSGRLSRLGWRPLFVFDIRKSARGAKNISY